MGYFRVVFAVILMATLALLGGCEKNIDITTDGTAGSQAGGFTLKVGRLELEQPPPTP